MAELKCPGYQGAWFWGWFGECLHLRRRGGLVESSSLEFLCRHPHIEAVRGGENCSWACPTKGRRA